MRQIKFRAWDSKGEYFKPLADDGDYYFRDNGDGLELHDKFGRCKDTVLLQFTGLLDKNGKEIYEGDVLSGWRKGSNSDREYIGVVEWRTDQAGWIIKCGKYFLEILSLAMSGDGSETRLDSFEVIGNIYETNQLLTP